MDVRGRQNGVADGAGLAEGKATHHAGKRQEETAHGSKVLQYLRLPFMPPMQPIQMVDLGGQHARIQDELDRALLDVVRSGAYIKGPDVDAFADELAAFTGAAHVIPCANGTDALQPALMALDIRPGDEVITTGFTFIATIEVVALLGATPVLVDVDPRTFNIDVDQVRKAVTPRTRAIVPVHLFGQPADLDALL